MKKRFVLYVVISLMAVISISSEFTKYYSEGEKAYQTGQIEKAKKDLNYAIQSWSHPDGVKQKAEAYALLGTIYMTEKKYKESLDSYNQAVTLNPKDDRSYFRMGLIYMDEGKNKEAIQQLKKTVALNPKFMMAHKTMGDVYRKLREPEFAIQSYAKVTAQEPKNDSAYTGIGDAYYMLKKYNPAIQELKKAIEINPHNAIAYYTLGLCYSAQEKYDEAIDVYVKALTAKVLINEAFKVHLYTFLGEAYEKKGRTDDAKKAYEKAKTILDNIPLKE